MFRGDQKASGYPDTGVSMAGVPSNQTAPTPPVPTVHVTIENTKQPKVTHTFETTGASSSQGHNKGSGAGSSTQKNSRSRSQPHPPSRNNPPRTGRDNRNTDRTTSQNAQRSAASTTPRSADEARRIAESEGEAYSFWKHPNVFAKLGLYGGPDGAPTSRQVCYTCESPGHLSNQCIVNAILILQDQIIKNIGQGTARFISWILGLR